MAPDGDARPPGASLVETHVSVVFFVGDRAYKLKKPVCFDFVDQSTRVERERLCHREVALNRRLAPDVYEGVADILGPDGEPCDHLVVMKRMPPDRRLSALVAGGDAGVVDAVGAIGRQLADFHAHAERSPEIDRQATRDAVAGLWRANFDQLRPFAGSLVDGARLDRAGRLAEAFLGGRGELFAERIAGGCICDGHGDLLTDDIYVLDDGPRILDCLEFADRLRFGDVVADLAFLVMDLERLGAASLARSLVESYGSASGAAPPVPLLHLYVAYRAQVRAMVACLRADQGGDRAAAAEQGRALLELCIEHLEAATVRLVVVGGSPGTGKSTLAAGLGGRLGATVVRSDVVRKGRAGLDPDRPASAPFGAGIYTDAATDETYAAMLVEARRELGLGRSVVLDASFGAARHRAEARRAATECGAALTELECVLGAEVAAARIADRRERGDDPSDADAAVADRMRQSADRWPERTPVSTAGPIDDVVSQAAALVAGAT